MITEIKLQELENLYNQTTEGTWFYHAAGNGVFITCGQETLLSNKTPFPNQQLTDNAKFVTESKNNFEKLISTVKQLKNKLSDIEGLLHDCLVGHDRYAQIENYYKTLCSEILLEIANQDEQTTEHTKLLLNIVAAEIKNKGLLKSLTDFTKEKEI